MQGDKVCARKDRLKLGFLHAQITRSVNRQERIERQNLHFQAECAISNNRANIPAADHTECFAVKLNAHVLRFFPLSGLGRGVGRGNLTG